MAAVVVEEGDTDDADALRRAAAKGWGRWAVVVAADVKVVLVVATREVREKRARPRAHISDDGCGFFGGGVASLSLSGGSSDDGQDGCARARGRSRRKMSWLNEARAIGMCVCVRGCDGAAPLFCAGDGAAAATAGRE